MKTVVVVLGVLGLADAVLVPLLVVLDAIPQIAGPAGAVGYLGACVCFGSLAMIDAVSAGKAGAKSKGLPTADEILGPGA